MPRTDIHSPTNFEPADYTYVGSFDNWPSPGAFYAQANPVDFKTEFGTINALTWSHATYLGGRAAIREKGAKIRFNPDLGTSQCDHCGAHIRYVTVYRHTNGELIAVGNVCADERFGCSDRREYDIKRLREAAANERERVAAFGKALLFVREKCPEMEQWLLSPAAEQVHQIFADMARRLSRWGSLSDKQVAFARKLLQEHFERQRNGGRTDREIQREQEHAAAEDVPEGRHTVTGTIVKLEYRESQWGGSLKMALKTDRGFVLWGTVPSGVENPQKGDKVEITATLERSERDPKFGFYKRPYGRILATATAS